MVSNMYQPAKCWSKEESRAKKRGHEEAKRTGATVLTFKGSERVNHVTSGRPMTEQKEPTIQTLNWIDRNQLVLPEPTEVRKSQKQSSAK